MSTSVQQKLLQELASENNPSHKKMQWLVGQARQVLNAQMGFILRKLSQGTYEVCFCDPEQTHSFPRIILSESQEQQFTQNHFFLRDTDEYQSLHLFFLEHMLREYTSFLVYPLAQDYVFFYFRSTTPPSRDVLSWCEDTFAPLARILLRQITLESLLFPRLQQDFLFDLFFHPEAQTATLIQHATFLQFDLSTAYTIVIFDGIKEKQSFIRSLQEHLLMSMYCIYQEKLICLFAQTVTRVDVYTLCMRHMNSTPICVGISNQTSSSIASFRHEFQHALEAIQSGLKHISPTNPIQIVFYKEIADLHPEPVPTLFIDAIRILAHYDNQRANRDLLPTLQEYIACNGSSHRVAANLKVAESSVSYRLKQIEQLLREAAIDLDIRAGINWYHLQYAINALQKQHKL